MRGKNIDLISFWSAGDSRTALHKYALLSPVAMILVLLEPFDTGELPLVARLIYWSVMIGALGLLMPPCVRWAKRIAAPFTERPAYILGLACVAAAVPISALVHGAEWFLGRIAVSVLGRATPPVPGSITDPRNLMQVFGLVVLVTALIVGGISLVARTRGSGRSGRVGPPPGGRFLSRLPRGMSPDLLCIRMEDHYLRVTTGSGEALILMRMTDALKELEDYPGFQVHRSWWIASSEIARLARRGRHRAVVLTNGAEVPVSSSHRDRIERFVASGLSAAEA